MSAICLACPAPFDQLGGWIQMHDAKWQRGLRQFAQGRVPLGAELTDLKQSCPASSLHSLFEETMCGFYASPQPNPRHQLVPGHRFAWLLLVICLPSIESGCLPAGVSCKARVHDKEGMRLIFHLSCGGG